MIYIYIILVCVFSGSFVIDVLAKPLNRLDLVQKLDRYVSEFCTSNVYAQPNGVSGKKSGKRQTGPTLPVRRGKQNLRSKKGAGSSSTSDPQVDSFRQEMKEMLSNIEKILLQQQQQQQQQQRESSPYGKFYKGSMIDNYESLFQSNHMLSPAFLNGKDRC